MWLTQSDQLQPASCFPSQVVSTSTSIADKSLDGWYHQRLSPVLALYLGFRVFSLKLSGEIIGIALSVADRKIDHKPGGFKQQKCVLSQLWRQSNYHTTLETGRWGSHCWARLSAPESAQSLSLRSHFSKHKNADETSNSCPVRRKTRVQASS